MKNLNLLIVEGNLQKENENFKKSGIETHTESLKDSLSYYRKDLNIDVFNPCSEESFNKVISKNHIIEKILMPLGEVYWVGRRHLDTKRIHIQPINIKTNLGQPRVGPVGQQGCRRVRMSSKTPKNISLKFNRWIP